MIKIINCQKSLEKGQIFYLENKERFAIKKLDLGLCLAFALWKRRKNQLTDIFTKKEKIDFPGN